MKKIAIAAALSAALSACTSLTYQERNTLRSLQAQGITVRQLTFDKTHNQLKRQK